MSYYKALMVDDARILQSDNKKIYTVLRDLDSRLVVRNH